MRLYLSSRGLGNCPRVFKELVGDNKRVAIIMNAQDLAHPSHRLKKLQKETDNLTALGLQPEELDLRDYFDKLDGLARLLKHFGAVWVRGGNVFVLRRAMKQSGFDEIIRRLLESDRLVYGGFSAGSCVASSDLHGIELVDDPICVPKGYEKAIIWEGLSLVSYAIAPHYRSNHPESPAIERLVTYFGNNRIPYKTLHDGDAILITGSNVSLLT